MVGYNPTMDYKLNTVMNPLDLVIVFFDTIIRIVSHKSKNRIHARDRRKTPTYRKKQKIVKKVWAVSLILIAIMLQWPEPFWVAMIAILGFLTTIVSFVILDETE